MIGVGFQGAETNKQNQDLGHIELVDIIFSVVFKEEAA
jgi:hypothetical protein